MIQNSSKFEHLGHGMLGFRNEINIGVSFRLTSMCLTIRDIWGLFKIAY